MRTIRRLDDLKHSLAIVLVVSAPFMMNACKLPDPLQGRGIQLWGGDQEKPAEAAGSVQGPAAKKQDPGKPENPAPTCQPNLSKSALDPADPLLVALNLAVEAEEKKPAALRSAADVRTRLNQLAVANKLGYDEDQIKKLARAFGELSRNQAGDDVTRFTADAAKPLAEAATPTPVPSKFRPTITAVIAFEKLIKLMTDADQMATPEKELKERSQAYALKLLGTRPPEFGYIAVAKAFDLARKHLKSSKADAAHQAIQKIMDTNKGNEAAALLAWVNTYDSEFMYGGDEKEAFETANHAACFTEASDAPPATSRR